MTFTEGSSMTEYSVPIMFDVVASSREAAAKGLVDILDNARLSGKLADDGDTHVDAWWTIKATDKHADRNDRDSGVVTFEVGSGA